MARCIRRFYRVAISLKIRNGVCVNDGNKVLFAISDDFVTFYQFATMFRDGLHCKNALFFDGSGFQPLCTGIEAQRFSLNAWANGGRDLARKIDYRPAHGYSFENGRPGCGILYSQ